MRKFQTLRKDNKEEYQIAYEPQEYPFKRLTELVLSNKKNVCSIHFGAFDTETTTYIEHGKAKGFMYLWQLCFDGVCVYGHEWEEFFTFMETVHSITKSKIILYVHNLGYEYQFMYRYLFKYYRKVEVFSAQKRKPISVRCDDKLEFRCSWKLSNMSLHKATLNELGNPYLKAIGDLDYDVYRDKLTPLSDTEFGYGMMDVLALYHYILHKMENEGDDLLTIPLTSTSYVRRECRAACKADRSYMQSYRMQKLTPMVYTLLKEAGRGGDTASNYRMTNQEIADVDSHDVASSYPYQLCTQNYPITRFYPYGEINSEEELNALCDKKAVLFRCAFKGLKMKRDAVNLYLSASKAIEIGNKMKIANGRVMSAPAVTFTFTDIDWELVQRDYTWDEVVFTDVYVAKYGYLPDCFVNVIMSYFKEKCELKYKVEHCTDPKEKENYEYLYAKSKNRLNGIFGMAYTDPVRDEIFQDLDDECRWKSVTPDVAEALKDTYRASNNFLVYAWGAWTTAHARKHLHNLLDITGEGTIYWDTDSSKHIHDDEVNARILQENEKIKRICEARNAYCDVHGERFYLGIYEQEPSMKIFKTLGAKKYAYVDKKDKFHCTISGVAKNEKEPLLPDGAREMKTISNFKIGYTFHEAGGITLHHHEDEIFTKHCLSDPSQTFTVGASIGSTKGTHKIGVSKEYAKVLGINLYKS